MATLHLVELGRASGSNEAQDGPTADAVHSLQPNSQTERLGLDTVPSVSPRHVETDSAFFFRRVSVVESIAARILSRYRLPIVCEVEKRTGLQLAGSIDFGVAFQVAAEYVLFNGLNDNERPLLRFALENELFGDETSVLAAMLCAAPSLYEVVGADSGGDLVVRDVTPAAGDRRPREISVRVRPDQLLGPVPTGTYRTGRILRFPGFAMPAGLFLPLSSVAAQALTRRLTTYSGDSDHWFGSHHKYETAIHESCIRAYVEDRKRIVTSSS